MCNLTPCSPRRAALAQPPRNASPRAEALQLARGAAEGEEEEEEEEVMGRQGGDRVCV